MRQKDDRYELIYQRSRLSQEEVSKTFCCSDFNSEGKVKQCYRLHDQSIGRMKLTTETHK